MTRLLAYDVETFQNFFSVVFFDLTSEDRLLDVSKTGFSHPHVDTFVFAPEFGMDDREQLADFLKGDVTLVGFNNIMFDSPVMDFAIYEANNPMEIFELAQGLILRMTGAGYMEYAQHNTWNQIDLMKMMAFDALGVSLKQCAINLKWHRIQDLPIPFNAMVTEDDLGLVIDYNLNDVLITSKLYHELHSELAMREELSESYGINLMSASDSRMANLMLESIYSKGSGLAVEDFRFLRTERNLVWLGSCIGANIEFQSRTLNKLLSKIRDTVVVAENNFAFKQHVEFGGVEYDIGIGGLHSVDNSCIFETTNTHIIRDADVASYYPNIMLKNKIRPAHLSMNFITILERITKQRIQAKRDGYVIMANGLKITINSIFGKLGSDTFWLQDAKALLSVTLSGQLYLLMLIEMLYNRGIKTISANTDGIVCRIPIELEGVYHEACREWEERTGFELEYTNYSRYIRADVNNYITIKEDGKTKEKGRFVTEIGLKRGYRHPIVPQAVYSHFVEGVPVIDTLLSSTDILDFCISQKSGGKFDMEFVSEDGVERLQKTNRFYVCDGGGGKLQKRNRMNNSVISLMATEDVVILNDYDEGVPMEDYNVNYNYYAEECRKYIEAIESGEFSFDMPEEPDGYVEEDKFGGNYPDEDEIQILPPKFRYSGGTYKFNYDTFAIYRGLSPINFFTDDSAEPLYAIRKEQFEGFLDFLIYVAEFDTVKINSRQMEMLIKIKFFEEFGGNKKLLQFWEEFTSGKFRYSATHKELTKAQRVFMLSEIWDEIPDRDFSIPEQVEFELEILGFIQSTFSVAKRTVYVIETINEEQRKKSGWSAVLHVYGLRTGRDGQIRVPRKTMNLHPIKDGMFIYYTEAETRPAYRKVEGGFEPIDGKYNYWIYNYETRSFA